MHNFFGIEKMKILLLDKNVGYCNQSLLTLDVSLITVPAV